PGSQGYAKSLPVDKKEISVFAEVTDLPEWKKLPKIKFGAEIASQGNWIVTARIQFSDFPSLCSKPFVKHLEMGTPIRPLLKRTIHEIGLIPTKMADHILEQGGEGTVVGIVDSGCDFYHQNLIKQSKETGGETRLLSIWDQNGDTTVE